MALSVSGGRALPFLIVCESVQIILHTFNSAVSPPSGPRLIGVKRLVVSTFPTCAISRAAKRLRRRTVAEVNRCPSDDAPLAVDDEPEPSTAAKEGEPMSPGIIFDATLAAAGDPGRAHQLLHLRQRYPKPFRYELSRNLDVAVNESNPSQARFPSSSCKVVFAMPVWHR